MRKIINITVLLMLMLVYSIAWARTNPPIPPPPWFTGPLLATAGKTIPAGHQNYEPYIFYSDDIGIYTNKWQVPHTAQTHIANPLMIFTQGLTSFMDLQLDIPYSINFKNEHTSSSFNDLTAILGFQLMHDTPHTIIPDLRFTILEVFPVGRYRNLKPDRLGGDATGNGAYTTGIGANFQKLVLIHHHFLRTRLDLKYTFSSKVTVFNFNTYGGGFNTYGTVRPGNLFSADLAFEFALTRNWVPAIDFLYNIRDNAHFSGRPGISLNGSIPKVGISSGDQFSIAPGLEYNFNAHLGVIGGIWWSIRGRNTPDFISGVFAINYFI